MFELVLAMLIVIVGSALCSGSEAALFSVPLVKAQQLAQSNGPSGKILLHIRKNMSRPIATIVILNNIFNIVGSIAVGIIAANVLGDLWVGLISGILTFLVIICAEIVPKTVGERYSAPIALFVARPIATLTALMFPLVWLVEQIVSPITRGPPRPSTNEAEIKLLTQIGQREEIIEIDEADMIQRVFRLNDVTAADVMTPRVSLTFLWGNKTLAQTHQEIVESQHSRIIVFGTSVDDVVGIVHKHQLLVELLKGNAEQTIASLARQAQFVPELVRADKLLATFRTTRQHIAVVVDSFGGTAGIVTLEDVLEELTGEIVDETDAVVDMQEMARQRGTGFLPKQKE
ncbi:MAG: HlyC/CorC family transporter [Chloroflexi bacterium AL-W]|nr:HlyC/CorC family transporter [Chloroflexi bacterium AL-N1]NOK64946.1 HlyC/CorC family transporter [Chloroflexi bacterium AL-N10]NOK76716.1 HlyC/CorC family transporter [Chloroflexi bacterium AL-N5]NOK84607.1 HlyC/CorC family transporter [Chloroflexi bacterium AL-W]NOK86568.1 HlyC/CorC family transporter [Chloroflexi bacterium AL-N15]